MGTFVVKSLGFIAILALLIGVTNYCVDPAGLFSDASTERQIATYLQQGSYVTNVSNYDERIFQRFFVEGEGECPHTVVLGSSRTFLMRRDSMTQESLINNSVPGASVQDMVAIYQLYKTRGCAPRKIYLNVDPWFFNANSRQERWVTLDKYVTLFNEGHQAPVFNMPGLYNIKRLFSLKYFQESFTAFTKNEKSTTPKAVKVQPNQDHLTRLGDGSIVYPVKYTAIDQAEVDKRVDKYLGQPKLYAIGGFSALDGERMGLFNRLLDDMKTRGIEVELLLFPYHPRVYDFLRTHAEYGQVFATEQVVKAVAAERHLKLAGSFDPALLGLGEAYFLDGMHLNEAGISRFYDVMGINAGKK